MDLQENTTVKQNKAGVTNQDLPWWFNLYHTAWALSFIAVWYYFGFISFIGYLLIVAILFLTFA